MDGSEALRRILNGLGVRSSLGECQRYVDECGIENLRAGKLNNAPFDLARAGKYRVRKGATDSWRTELSKWEIALVERLAGPLMSELGFKSVSRSKIMSVLLDLGNTVKDVRRAATRRLQMLAER